jgi:hypothetical protein
VVVQEGRATRIGRCRRAPRRSARRAPGTPLPCAGDRSPWAVPESASLSRASLPQRLLRWPPGRCLGQSEYTGDLNERRRWSLPGLRCPECKMPASGDSPRTRAWTCLLFLSVASTKNPRWNHSTSSCDCVSGCGHSCRLSTTAAGGQFRSADGHGHGLFQPDLLSFALEIGIPAAGRGRSSRTVTASAAPRGRARAAATPPPDAGGAWRRPCPRLGA